MEIQDFIRRILRVWPLVLGLALVGALIGSVVGITTTERYSATTDIFLGTRSGDGSQTSDVSETQLKSYAQTVQSDLVLAPAAQQLRGRLTRAALADTLAVEIPSGTQIIRITSTVTDPQLAADAANATAAALQSAGRSLYPKNAAGQEAIKSTVLTKATAPATPSAPNKILNAGAGLALGLLVGTSIAASRRPGTAKRVRHDDLPDGPAGGATTAP